MKKTARITIRLSEEEQDYLEAMAHKAGISVGEFIRRSIQKAGAVDPGDEFLCQIQDRLKAALLDTVMREVRAGERKVVRGGKKAG